MIPRRLRATNFRSYADLDLELPAGVCAIVGANGAGKSSLLTMIEIALFGAGARSLAPYLTTGAADTEMMVELELAHRGEHYRTRRSYSARGRGQAKVDLERLVLGDDRWEPLSGESAAETQALIEQTLGITRDTFRASAFLAQGDGACFADAAPARRREILADILGLGEWDARRDRVRADRRPVDEGAQRLAARIEDAEAETAGTQTAVAEREGAQAFLDDTRRQITEDEQELARVQEALIDAERSRAALVAAGRALRDRQEKLYRLADRIGRLADEDADLRTKLADRDRVVGCAAKVADLERAQADLRADHAAYRHDQAARMEAGRMVATAREARERALDATRRGDDRADALRREINATVGEAAASCPTCGQEIHGGARERTLARLLAQLDACAADAAEHEAAAARAAEIAAEGEQLLTLPDVPEPGPLAPVEEALREARAAQVALAELDTHARRLDAIGREAGELGADMTREGAARDAAQTQLAELGDVGGPQEDELGAAAATLRSRIAAARTIAEDHARQVARCDERLDRLARVAAQLTADRAEQARLGGELEVLRQLDRAFSAAGIPALILENAAIPQIEQEACRILTELGTPYQVELRTQRALKTGDGVREALDIVVLDGGLERGYETYSGGERTRLNLALRIALARLLAHRRGADVRLLALDEPEFLDADGMDQLARVLHGLTDDFDRIIVVSHVPALRDAFDEVLEIERGEDGLSRIVGAREGVAA